MKCKNSDVGRCSEHDKPKKSRKCGEVACPHWSVGYWSKCSKTCGGGIRSRTVSCENKHVGECLQLYKPDKTKKCGKAPCPKWSVGQWSKCSKSCGGGFRSRTVSCMNSHVGKCSENYKPDKIRRCGDLPCPQWKIGQWRKCSKTCGEGMQLRSVYCQNNHVGKCSEISKPAEMRKCSEAPCPHWFVGPWGTCSKTCGGGTQSRTVTCKNRHVGKCSKKDKPHLIKKCSEAPCPEWISSQWTKCSRTCGGGTQSRTVTCKNRHVGKCVEEDKPNLIKECSKSPCPEWVSGPWDKCSKTCDGGTQSRTVTCKNSHVGKCSEKDKPNMIKECSKSPCPEWVSGQWSKCSKTCGVGTQSRTVTCKNSYVGKCVEKDKPNLIKECGKSPCPEWVSGPWGKCSKTCGGGTQSRTVTCKNSDVGKCSEEDKPDATQECSKSPCPEWVSGPWGKCSKTCDGGTQSRIVTCKNSHVGQCLDKDKPVKTKKCSEAQCPVWTVGQWSKCSRSCGGGIQSRTVSCKNNHVGKCSFKNKPDVAKRCGYASCPEWVTGQWSKCSKTCGGGTQTRTVSCANRQVGRCPQEKKPISRKTCVAVPCPSWLIGNWSKCSKTCGSGERAREVWCSAGEASACHGVKPTNREPCNEGECSHWDVTEWSKCMSRKCGRGKKYRSATCSGSNGVGCNNKEKPARLMACQVECPVWRTSKWKKVSNVAKPREN